MPRCSPSPTHHRAAELRKNKRELLAPISMSFESRVSKLMQHALALAHKLLSHQALNAQGCESVLTALLSSFAAQSSLYLGDESLALKLLQTLLVLSSATQFALSGDYLAQSLNLAFRLLMHSKAPAVHPLAHAAVRQLVSATFEVRSHRATVPPCHRATTNRPRGHVDQSAAAARGRPGTCRGRSSALQGKWRACDRSLTPD